MQHWHDFGLRARNPLPARTRLTQLPPRLKPFLDAREALLQAPLEGIIAGAERRTGLYPLSATGVSTQSLVDAASEFLQGLTPQQRDQATFAVDATEWRTWLNVHMNVYRHGILLETLDTPGRERALKLMRETLSARGFRQARDIMRINEFLVELTGSQEEYGEWPYFISIFGTPSRSEPWGWQIDGHHLNLNCFVLGEQLVLAPAFMGSEPCRIDTGPLAGTRTFEPEQRVGLDFMRALTPEQAAQAIVRSSIMPADLPTQMQHPFDGRMKAGAFQDNARIEFAGVRAESLDDAQRKLLSSLIATYVGWARDGHAGIKMDEVQRHLDETWFCWMGAVGDDGPFYYRVLSPVVLIEFDHHPGVVFDNLNPTPHHIHTIVRAPNGGDYGVDLLRQHHERFDHSHGHHHPRS